MTCREFIGFLMEYVSEELATAQRAKFERHLATCPQCAAYLKSYQETVKLGKAICSDLDEPVPPEVPEEPVQAILAARTKAV